MYKQPPAAQCADCVNPSSEKVKKKKKSVQCKTQRILFFIEICCHFCLTGSFVFWNHILLVSHVNLKEITLFLIIWWDSELLIRPFGNVRIREVTLVRSFMFRTHILNMLCIFSLVKTVDHVFLGACFS